MGKIFEKRIPKSSPGFIRITPEEKGDNDCKNQDNTQSQYYHGVGEFLFSSSMPYQISLHL
jgi:hypothetical protein